MSGAVIDRSAEGTPGGTAADPVAELEARLHELAPPEWVAAVDAGDHERLEAFAGTDAADALVQAVAAEGWMTPHWPPAHGGRGLDEDAAARVAGVVRRWAIGSVNAAIGVAWVGPTIAEVGTAAQQARYLPPIARYEELWCQLFSEPEAGSDLAGVRARATRDGDGWRIDGVKMWTSRAHLARRGLLVARTDIDVAKHAGLTCFCVDMTAPGVTVSPIRQMTGDAEFYETRLDGVVVPDDDRLGPVGDGWRVVRTVLANERRGGSGVGASPPGSVVGRSMDELVERHRGRLDPVRRDRLVAELIDARLIEWTNARYRDEQAADPGAPNRAAVTKVLQAHHTQRLQELFVDLDGGAGVAWPAGDRWAEPNRWAFLRVRAKTIAGGTSEILRNQVAERVLGLPRETDASKGVPFRQVARSGAVARATSGEH
ncbi:MAG: acyl-CoA dehydrogenase family protein [Actinomycetota bacterium]|nr:acyl-CoA dehydrogenase family protein [Actinomycetota bacterium]